MSGKLNNTTLLHFGVGRQDCTSQRQKRGYLFYFFLIWYIFFVLISVKSNICGRSCGMECVIWLTGIFFHSKAKQQCASLVRRDTRTGVPASASGPGCGVSVFSCVHLQRSCAPPSPFPRASWFCSPLKS